MRTAELQLAKGLISKTLASRTRWMCSHPPGVCMLIHLRPFLRRDKQQRSTNCCSASEGRFAPMQKKGAVHTKSTRHSAPERSIKTYRDKKKAVDQDIGQ